ncbi:MAG: serine hydrolase [Maribacter litoralis]|uniref:serine hydrolase n=1 Tax=Maribacter litoralis TaxID=2059726 RepID=UPI0032990414
MKFKYSLLFGLFIQLSFGQLQISELNGVENEISLIMNQYKAVGLAVAIVKDNKVIYSKGFGYRDMENQLPANANTIFPIGSTTKAFTGSLLGILESKNQVFLKDKPAKYIPNFQFYNEKMDNLITIDDLLSHRSGIGNQGTSEVLFPEKNKLEVIQRLRYLKPEGEIKNSFEYSNMGYTLAGTIVEQITNKSWDKMIEENIFKPLGMKNSYTTLKHLKQSNNYSLPYGIFEEKIEKVKFEEFNSISPAGAIKSTVNDLANWMLTWLNNGMFNEKQVIPQNYISEATRLQNIKGGTYEKDAFLFGDGFGWRLRSTYGHYRIDHGGNTFGFSSSLVMFPFEKLGIVVLTNQDNSLLPYMITDNITRRLFKLNTSTEEYPVVVTDIFKPDPNEKGLNKNKLPTHDVNTFCGTYKANGFGEIKIVNEENNLYAILPTFKFQLEHLNYNSFFLKATQEFNEVFNPQFTIQFINNTKGDISQLKMYSQKEPVEFYKKDDTH